MATQRVEHPIAVTDWQIEQEVYEQTISSIEQTLRDNPWMLFLELTGNCDTTRMLYFSLLKRCFDIVFGLFLIVILSPFLLIIAIAIYLDLHQPILFRQTRIGKGGKPFVIYKFRTMIPDRRRANLPFDGVDRRQRHKTPHDPRITRFGRFLRRTSIDELPQLINILRGEMSFIGPRPELPQIVNQYAPWQHQRHLVRPGLTGWWQIQGRSDLPMHEHTELDIYYVNHLSFELDLRIFLRTVVIVLLRSGAY